MTEEGRCERCEGGVEGGSLDAEIRSTLIAGERDGELARYNKRSAPDCFALMLSTRFIGGGVRGGDEERMLLEGSLAKEGIGRSWSSSSD